MEQEQEQKYRCPDPRCGWVGTEDDMDAEDIDDAWSNWICPRCRGWHQLEDYEPIDQ